MALLHLTGVWAADAKEEAEADDPEIIEVENLISMELVPVLSEQSQAPNEVWAITEPDQLPVRKKLLSPQKSPADNDSMKISVKSTGPASAKPPAEEIYDTKIRMVRIAPKIESTKTGEQQNSAFAKDKNFKIVLMKTAKSRRPASVKKSSP
jgi:hypothetical protein